MKHLFCVQNPENSKTPCDAYIRINNAQVQTQHAGADTLWQAKRENEHCKTIKRSENKVFTCQ